MELILGGVLIIALGIVYFTAKKNGKLEEANRAKSKTIEGLAKDFDTLQAQMYRWDDWREKVHNRLSSINVQIIPDTELGDLWKDPTSVLEDENTVTAKLEEIKPTK